MFRIILLLTYVILFTCGCNVDKEVSKTENQAMLTLLDRIVEADPVKDKPLIQEALDLILNKKNIHDSILVKTYFKAGNYYNKIGAIDSASIFYQKAIGYINDSIQSKLQIRAFQKAHLAYRNLGAFGECAAIATKFRSLIDMENDARNKATYYGFKEEYFKSNPLINSDSILKYNQLGIDMTRLSNQNNQAANLLITRAAHITSYLRDYERSSKIFELLINSKDSLLTDTKRLLYNDFGILKYFQEDFTEAIVYYKKGLELIDDFVDKRNRLAGGYGNIAEAYLQLNDYKNTGLYLDSMKSNEKSGVGERFIFFRKNLELELEFKKERNITKSINSIKRYASELRSINAKKYKSDLKTLEQTLESRKIALEESNKDKLQLLYQKWYSYLLAFSLFAVLILGYFFYRQKKIKFELQQLLLQQRLLRSQMNPHFTYNFLSIIKSQIKSNQARATEYLLKFSRLLRMILDNSTYNYVEIGTETEILTKYVELQALRFPKGLSLDFKYKNMDEEDLIFVPPMIFQPILENCIVHAFADIEHQGEICLQLTKEKKFIHCEIEDNGSGFNIMKVQNRKSSTNLISEFLGKISSKKLEFINKTNGQSGTIVKFSLPYKYSQFD